MDISRGKFELGEWHAIADEWYKAKQNRNSDESDAPCMLRKGLPRAFPGLEELKSESMKEGTQYKSRVFQSSDQLIQGGWAFDHDRTITSSLPRVCCAYVFKVVYIPLGFEVWLAYLGDNWMSLCRSGASFAHKAWRG